MKKIISLKQIIIAGLILSALSVIVYFNSHNSDDYYIESTGFKGYRQESLQEITWQQHKYYTLRIDNSFMIYEKITEEDSTENRVLSPTPVFQYDFFPSTFKTNKQSYQFDMGWLEEDVLFIKISIWNNYMQNQYGRLISTKLLIIDWPTRQILYDRSLPKKEYLITLHQGIAYTYKNEVIYSRELDQWENSQRLKKFNLSLTVGSLNFELSKNGFVVYESPEKLLAEYSYPMISEPN